MRSTFSTLEIARSTLLASQVALDTTGQNIANANTEGYSRQEVQMGTLPALDYYSGVMQAQAGQIGSGVTVQSIQRDRVYFLDDQYRYQNQNGNYYNSTSTTYAQIESIINEPSTNGLNQAMQDLETSFQNLSGNATNSDIRTQVQGQMQTVVDRFNQIYQQFTQLQKNIDSQVTAKANEISGYLQNIASLEGQIQNVMQLGKQPNDLLDQRDELLDKLSADANITVARLSNEQIQITMGGQLVYDGSSSPTISPNPASITATASPGVLIQANGTTLTNLGGQVGALIDARDTTLAGYVTQLQGVASNLVSNVNSANAGGFDNNGAAGGNLFNTGSPPNTIIGLVSSDSNKIAASKNGDLGDGLNAINLANSLGGSSGPIQAYQNEIASIGVNSQQAKSYSQNAQLLIKQLDNQRQQVSGVSLDEEASNLIKYQYQYQAAARVMNVFSSIMDTLMHTI